MFSVVIPLHNKSDYILKSLFSVLDQSYRNFEVIIIDDGSVDDSLSKVQKIKDKRVRIYSQPNSGVSTARNNGVKKAKFELIAFLDADDWWDKGFLAELKSLIEKFPEAGIYGSNYYYVKNEKNIIEYKGFSEEFLEGYINYFKIYSETFCVPFNCSFVIVRKTAFNHVGGFKPELKYAEDLDLWIRISLEYKVAYINKPLAYSNQDVINTQRALGCEKYWGKEEHIIFNLDYLRIEEKKIPELKKLLDGLRLRSLVRYHLAGMYKVEVAKILNEINFFQHPFTYRIIYKCPVILIKLYWSFIKFGANIKQTILKRFDFTE